MIRKSLLTLIFIELSTFVFGQEVVIKSFENLQTDLTARTQQKLDANGNPCAVVKVDIPLEDVVFKGWVVESVSTPGEYLVYMPEGATKITMQHKTLTPFTFEFDKPLTGKSTYRLIASIKRVDPSKPVYKVIEVSDEIKECYNRGVSLLNSNEKEKAQSLIQNAANAGYAPAQYLYGQQLSEKDAISWYLKAASQGFAEAICGLGDAYMKGNGVAQDPERAFKYYMEATDLDYSKAMVCVGKCLEDGNGTPQDLGKAFWFYKKAADAGMISAYSKIAYCYLEGNGTGRDVKEGIKWLKRGVEEGDAISCLKLGYIYGDPNTSLYGLEMKDEEEAYRLYRIAAEKGNPEAQVMIGSRCRWDQMKMYYKGNKKESERYFKEALMWYQKAADQGNESGILFIDNYNKYRLLLNEAEHGDSKAQYDLGIMYLQDSPFVNADIQKGIEWLNKSGSQKYLEALIKLGDIYYDYFELTPIFYPYDYYKQKEDDRLFQSPNHKEAAKYYRKAAELGNFHSQVRLAELYDRGKYGLNKDIKEAEKWYIKAANHEVDLSYNQSWTNVQGRAIPTKGGISEIQYEMWKFYKNLKNEKEAIKWLRKAAHNGSYSAKRRLEYEKNN